MVGAHPGLSINLNLWGKGKQYRRHLSATQSYLYNIDEGITTSELEDKSLDYRKKLSREG